MVHTPLHHNLQLSTLQCDSATVLKESQPSPAKAPLVPVITIKSRQTRGPRGGVRASELNVQWVGAEWDADSGQVLCTNPDRTPNRGFRTDEELNRKPEDSDTQHRGGQCQSHTHAHLPPSLVSTQSARKPTYPQGYGFYHCCPPRGLV